MLKSRFWLIEESPPTGGVLLYVGIRMQGPDARSLMLRRPLIRIFE
jgi:hypothetical protein